MNHQVIGRRIIHLDQVDSTNSYLVHLLEDHYLPEGSLVVARDQYAGRGMEGNQWESQPGMNLTFSIVLYPSFLPPEKQFMLNKMISLSLSDYAGSKIDPHRIRIKWPNDLYIDDKKAAGILIHNTIQGFSFIHAVVGIGMNINQVHFTSTAPNPVSLKTITGIDYDLVRSLSDLSECLDRRYRELRLGAIQPMNEAYLHKQYRMGVFYPYYYRNERIEARIEQVDDVGRLILKTAKGRVVAADPKELVYIQ